jgi:predicted  nucleic acid-binding Zn-ribbon protein
MTLESSGTTVDAGSFRCTNCDYVLTLDAAGTLATCPNCGGLQFERSSLFTTSIEAAALGPPAPGTETERLRRLGHAKTALEAPGDYLCYEEHGEMRIVPLTGAWTRIGRSLSADIHLEDQTVSRRHALIVREADSIRALDDRSMNGLFLNGERIDSATLEDGDELLVGRYRLLLVRVRAGANSEHTNTEPTAGTF